MKKVILSLIVISYIIPSAFKLITYIREDFPVYRLGFPLLSSVFLVVISFLTSKGGRISKYLTCIFFMLCGLLMLPYFIAPAIESLSIRLFLGASGVWWIASSVWIFCSYSKTADTGRRDRTRYADPGDVPLGTTDDEGGKTPG